jgi:hypothetical protein
MDETAVFRDRTFGKFFGFPDCCVDAYCSKTLKHGVRPLCGFRRCDACAARPLEQLISEINARRICPKPFPLPPTSEDFQTILKDSRLDAAERECIASHQEALTSRSDEIRGTIEEMHARLSATETKLVDDVKREPAREQYFRAMFEVERDEQLNDFVERQYLIMREVFVRQVKSGHIKIRH